MIGVHLLSGPLVVAMVNAYGCRIVCIIGSILTSVALWSLYFIEDIHIFGLSYVVVLGFGLSMMYVPALIAPSCYFEKKRGLAMGLSRAGSSLGMIVYPVMCTKMEHLIGLQITYLVLGFVSIIGVISGSVMKPLYLLITPAAEENKVPIDGITGEEDTNTTTLPPLMRRDSLFTGDLLRFIKRTDNLQNGDDIDDKNKSEMQEEDHTSVDHGTVHKSIAPHPLPPDTEHIAGSISPLEEVQSSRSTGRSKTKPERRLSVVKAPIIYPVCKAKDEEASRTIKSIIIKFSDYTLMKNTTFLLICLRSMVAYLGYDYISIFLIDLMTKGKKNVATFVSEYFCVR